MAWDMDFVEAFAAVAVLATYLTHHFLKGQEPRNKLISVAFVELAILMPAILYALTVLKNYDLVIPIFVIVFLTIGMLLVYYVYDINMRERADGVGVKRENDLKRV